MMAFFRSSRAEQSRVSKLWDRTQSGGDRQLGQQYKDRTGGSGGREADRRGQVWSAQQLCGGRSD